MEILRSWWVWVVLAVVVVAGLSLAKRRRPAAPAEGAPLRLSLEPPRVQLGVYFAAGAGGVPSTADLLAAVRSWVAQHAKEPLRASVERHLTDGVLALEILERNELPLPFDEVFDALSDPARARKRYEGATHAVVVQSTGPLAPPCAALWAGVGAARAIAAATDGLAYDRLTFRFVPEGRSSDDLPADGGIVATDHIVVPYSVGEDGRAWVTTVGLAKFGLPNLECRDVPPDVADNVGTVLNAVAQHLVARVLERPAAAQESIPRELVLKDEITITAAVFLAANGRDPKESGAIGDALVRLAYAPARPDGREPFLTLLPPRGFQGEQGVWLHELVRILEPEADPVVRRTATDPDLARAKEEARSRLPQVKRRFQEGLAPGETLFVKHGFADGGVVEHMWAAVTSWEGAMVKGTLANDPQDIPSLRAGQAVEIDEMEVEDWMLSRADGSHEGGFSVEVLRADKESE